MTHIEVMCEDSAAAAGRNRELLDIDPARAARLGHDAIRIIKAGHYEAPGSTVVDLRDAITCMRKATFSLQPEHDLRRPTQRPAERTTIRIVNATTIAAAAQLEGRGFRALALNFANGVHAGGGFLSGARAQEEFLCRNSALWASLHGDPMYEYHRSLPTPISSDWCILSQRVPFFRSDAGDLVAEPWFLDILSCAAPVASHLPPGEARPLLRRRIRRVLAVASAFEYRALVLGAWGCGAFKNDPDTTAQDFAEALGGELRGAFDEVVFAITDWSPERHFLGPFHAALAALATR